jgi:hypothetical protein
VAQFQNPIIVTSGTVAAGGGTDTIKVPALDDIEVDHIEVFVRLSAGHAYEGEGLDYIDGRIYNVAQGQAVSVPRGTEAPLRLWADGRPPNFPLPMFKGDGGEIAITNNHGTASAVVTFAIHVERV